MEEDYPSKLKPWIPLMDSLILINFFVTVPKKNPSVDSMFTRKKDPQSLNLITQTIGSASYMWKDIYNAELIETN